MSDSEDEIQSRTIKITIVGEPATGKTTLCTRYLGTNVVTNSGTQGAEVMAGQCLGLRPPIPLQLCDVAGNALVTKMLANYLYASDVVIFVYDLTNLQSFDRLSVWVPTVKKIFEPELRKPIMALFGNKSDLEHQRAVRLSSVQKLASQHLLENYKGSARTGDMVTTTFTNLVARVIGLKVRRLPALVVNDRLAPVPNPPEVKRTSPSPHQTETRQSLIMNRKALRRLQRGASSSVCCVQ